MEKEILAPELDSEIFVALTGRLGTDTRAVGAALASAFAHYEYGCASIQVSNLIRDAYPDEDIPDAPDGRITKLMTLGTRYRKENVRADALARLAVFAIMNERKKLTGKIDVSKPRTIFLINQLKRPEEITFLRDLYGRQLFVISCHAPYINRLKKLEDLFLLNHAENADIDHWRDAARRLIDKDDNEIQDTFGQRVQDAFPLADFFIDSRASLQNQARRIVDLIFGDPRISPTKDEFGSYMASSAGLRSNDLSRQVGAAILSEDGEVLALGCNEVPVAGGGVFWPDVHDTDSRDVALGADINTILKKDMIVDIFQKMKKADWFKKTAADMSPEELIKLHIEKKSGVLSKSKMLSSIEFGRAMHAEMTAITSAAKGGISIKGATLYCTTFPCHNCAKHIVGSGIKRVVFREPYQKSRAIQLYPDAIQLDADDPSYVSFDQFIGAGFSRFQDLFSKSAKKSKDTTGRVKLPLPNKMQPISAPLYPSYFAIEAAVANLDSRGR